MNDFVEIVLVQPAMGNPAQVEHAVAKNHRHTVPPPPLMKTHRKVI
jgi:hypothetical protein